MIQIEVDIKKTDSQIKDLQKKRNESEKLLKNIKANPDKFTSNQIDQLLKTLDDQIIISENLVQPIKKIEKDADIIIHMLN